MSKLKNTDPFLLVIEILRSHKSRNTFESAEKNAKRKENWNIVQEPSGHVLRNHKTENPKF